MNKFSKFLALVMVLVMALSLTVTAFAVDGDPAPVKPTYPTITISDRADEGDKVPASIHGNKFEAYQVFKGNYTEIPDPVDPSKTTEQLTDIAWGNGINDNGKNELFESAKAYVADPENGVDESTLPTITEATAGTEDVAAQYIAAAMRQLNNDSPELRNIAATIAANPGAKAKLVQGEDGEGNEIIATEQTASGSSITLTLKDGDGYYLVNGKVSHSDGREATSRYMVRVAGNATLQIKASVPTVIKKVKENETITVSNTDSKIDFTLDAGYNDAATYGIGDTVPFQLLGTLPTTLAGYNTYTYRFLDTLSAGLTFNYDSVKVYYVPGTTTNTKYEMKKVTSKTDATGYYVEETNGNISISFIDIKQAKLTADGVALSESGKILVEYTATLNGNAVYGPTGNPNTVKLQFSNNPNWHGDPTNPTDPSKPYDDIPKDETPEDKVVVYVLKMLITKVNAESADAEKVAGAKFVVTNKDGKYYKYTPAVPAQEATDTQAAQPAIPAKVEWVPNYEDEDGNVIEACVVESDSNGQFNIFGLEEGAYSLKEIEAPTGYNLLKNPIGFTVSANVEHKQDWAGTGTLLKEITVVLDATVTSDVANNVGSNLTGGYGSFTVKNSKGSQLPVTGGMGTTLFYVVGAILMIAAGVIMVTRKRMENED